MVAEPTISREPNDDPELRRRFEAILGAYFEALDAGQSPDRQELLARHPDLRHWLQSKRDSRLRDERIKPLSTYRSEELAMSHECFFGENRSYHEARRRFVYKSGAPCAVPVVAMPAPRPAVQPLSMLASAV